MRRSTTLCLSSPGTYSRGRSLLDSRPGGKGTTQITEPIDSKSQSVTLVRRKAGISGHWSIGVHASTWRATGWLLEDVYAEEADCGANPTLPI